MKHTAFALLGAFVALILISCVAAARDLTPNEIKTDDTNEVDDQKHYDGGYGGGWGGPGGGGGWGGWGPWGGWGGRGGGGGGWGGYGGGGWGGGRCRWGRCGGGYYGGRCCYNAQEALAYMDSQAQP